MSHFPTYDDGSGHVDTVALLTDEIARLEAELRSRDESDRLAEAAPAAPPPPNAGDADGRLAPLLSRLDGLCEEIAGRDETIALLLDQARLFEEADSARAAEYEQISKWVEEVERRVDDRGDRDSRAGEDLAAERRKAEVAHAGFEAERRGWEVSNRSLQAELADLRARDRSGDAAGPLEQENRRLREEAVRWARAAAEAEEVGPLRERLAEVQARLDEALAEAVRERDDRRRERNEMDAEIATLKSRLTRESLELAAAPAAHPAPENPLEADLRIRAFRQHLQDVHQREAEERATTGLAARLSRLWKHTAPG